MTREQMIDEMARMLCYQQDVGNCTECCRYNSCLYRFTAKEIYNAGFRKQSDGCEFCKEEKCGNCVVFVCENTDDKCCTTYDCEPCVEYRPIKYCPHCGAKMKGADDEK